jgi:ornithine decarboxylase
MLKSFVVMNKANVQKQAQIWANHLPYITPYYAVKSNNDQQLLRWITEVFEPHGIKAGFDCASITEMEQVRKVSKKVPIIYAQPCKTDTDLNESRRHGIRTTVVDSPEEMQKLRATGWKGDTLIRLAVPDNKSKQPFSKKFGAPIQWVPQIFELAQAYKIPIRGLSFHVGSECENPDQFAKALQMCRLVFDIAVESGIDTMNVIDIGGGFLPTNENLVNIASSIESARTKLFPNNLTPSNKPIEWIAEPGRFLSATSQTLYTPIIGRKRAMPSSEPDALEYRYTVHESIYGYFSNIPFDSQKPEFSVVYQKNQPLFPNRLHRSIIFGRTCDGADIINPAINLPLLKEGDWLEIDNMGAYTSVTASEFNGFPKPDMICLE